MFENSGLSGNLPCHPDGEQNVQEGAPLDSFLIQHQAVLRAGVIPMTLTLLLTRGRDNNRSDHCFYKNASSTVRRLYQFPWSFSYLELQPLQNSSSKSQPATCQSSWSCLFLFHCCNPSPSSGLIEAMESHQPCEEEIRKYIYFFTISRTNVLH